MINLIDQKFGRLIVVKQNNKDKNNHILWLCLCDCGQETIVQSSHLITGHTQSCGCIKRDGNNVKHRHTLNNKPSKIYQIWSSMIQRCTNPNHRSYHRYGGRDINVCQRWMKFPNFLKQMPGWKPGLQIDRIDNNKGYSKYNCKWSTRKQQARNRRNNHLITHKGKTKCLADWAEQLGIPYHVLWKRIYGLKWSVRKSLITPTRKYKKRRITL